MNIKIARLILFIAGACFLGVGGRLIYLKITATAEADDAAYRAGEDRRPRLARREKQNKPAARRRGAGETGSPASSPTPIVFAILTESLPMAAVGEEYREELKLQGATRAVAWRLEKGELPPGLELTPKGFIVGVPEKEGDYIFTVAATENGDGRRAARVLRLLVRKGDGSDGPRPLAILTANLPEPVLGKDYLQTISAEGGGTPYGWEIVAGSLPSLLLLNKESGAIYGIPRETGDFRFTLRLTDANGDWVEMSYGLSVREEGFQIVTAALPPAARGRPYSVRLTAAGGALPYAWELVAGILPEGLIFNPERGEIAGTAEKIAAAVILIRVRDAGGRTAEREFSLQVLEPTDGYFDNRSAARFRILNTSLAPAVRGRPYGAQLQAADGAPPYVWTVSQGSLPPQLFLDSATGAIGGIPEKEGISSFTVLVSDRNFATAQSYFSLVVNLQLVYITTGALNPAIAGQEYRYQLEATGGTPPYVWTLVSGSLPPDLSLNNSSGAISGRIADSFIGQGTQEFVFRVKANDPEGNDDTVELRLEVRESLEPTPSPSPILAGPSPSPTVNPGDQLSIDTTSLPDGTVGNVYSASLSARGGTAPYSWSATGLPSGLSLSSSGSISGTPSAVGTFAVTVSVSDAAGASAQAELPLSILAAYSETVSDLIAAPGDGKAGLAWKNPESSNFSSVKVIRKTGETPPNDPSDGTLVYQGQETDLLDTDLANGTTYSYAVIAYDQQGRPGKIYAGTVISVEPAAVSLFGESDPFADDVVSFSPLASGGFGANQMPEIALGAPRGEGSYQGSLDVVSLHARPYDGSGPGGGNIVLRFKDNIVVNGDGKDFTVFENAFYIGGSQERRWMEPAVVSVSQDGNTFYTFPYDYVPHFNGDGSINFYNPYSYFRGFAGVSPVFSNAGSPDPRSPSVSGGDSFDLSDITANSLSWIQFVKITAVGDNWLVDPDGDRVRHTPDLGSLSGAGSSGFDLDAVCAINY